jgi:hypothetical protein
MSEKKPDQLIELVRLIADLCKFAVTESGGVDNSIKIIKKAMILQNAKSSVETLDVILMNVTKVMRVTVSDIENDSSHSDDNLYSKMFTYILFKDVAKISQYKIAAFFEKNRTTIKRHVDKFYKLQEGYKPPEMQRYFDLFEKIKESVYSDINLLKSTSQGIGSPDQSIKKEESYEKLEKNVANDTDPSKNNKKPKKSLKGK